MISESNIKGKTLKTCKVMSVGNFFTDKTICKGKINIPPNQRPYAWDEANITDFQNDLENARLESKNGYSHYFNMITYVRDKENIDIHDGQQRISTSFFSLIFLMQGYKKSIATQVDENDIPSNMKIFGESLLTRAKEKRFNLFSYNNELLELVYECIEPQNKHEDFLTLLKEKSRQNNLDKYESNTKIINLFETLKHYCKAELDGNPQSYKEAFDTLYNNFEIVAAELNNSEQAYKIFELVNNRGQKLSDIDLVKNSMYQLAKDSSNPAKNLKFVEESIQELILKFGDEFEDVLSMHWLVYFNKSDKTNYGKPSKLFASFSNTATNFTNVENFLLDMIEKIDKIFVYRSFLSLNASEVLCENNKSNECNKFEELLTINHLHEMLLLRTFTTGLKMDYADFFLYYLFIEYQNMNKLHTESLINEYKKTLSFYFVRSLAQDRMILDKLNLRIGYLLDKEFGSAIHKDINLNKLFGNFLLEENTEKNSKYIETIRDFGEIISKPHVDTAGIKLKTLLYFGNWFAKPEDYFVENGNDYTLIEEEHIVPQSAKKESEIKYEKFNVSNIESKYRARIDWLGNKLLLTKEENLEAKDSFQSKVTLYSKSSNLAIKEYYYILVDEFLNDKSLSKHNILSHERDRHREEVIKKFEELSAQEVESKMLKIEEKWRLKIGKHFDNNDCLGIGQLLEEIRE